MFLCLSMSFIISISDMRSARSLSVALSGEGGLCHGASWVAFLPGSDATSVPRTLAQEPLPFSILTATVTALSGLSLSMP